MTYLAPLAIALLTVSASVSSYAEVLDYEVRETSPIGYRVVATGKRDYTITQVRVFPYERDGKYIAEKLLELEQGFKIGARIFNDRKLTGFGLLAQRSDNDFSWEWFSKESGSTFRKLQGQQPVEIKTVPSLSGEELAEVRFLEDTILEFKPLGATKFTHQIIVKAGSVLRLR